MNRQAAWSGLAIFVLAAAIRAAYVLLRWSSNGAALEFPDEELHWQLADNLVRRGSLVSNLAYYAVRMPVYPVFLALFASIGENGVLAAKLAQALLGGATAWLAYRWVRAAVGGRAAIIAGLLVCFDPYTIKFADLLLTEVLFILVGVALAFSGWAMIRARGDAPRAVVWLTALLGPAAVMTRPSSAGWILLMWCILAFADRNRRRGARRAAIHVAAFVLGILPWGIRNHMLLGDFAWLSTNGGITLFDAQGPQADGSSNQAFIDEMLEVSYLDEVSRDRVFRDLAIAEMRGDPGRVLRLAWVKLLRTWNPFPNVKTYSGGWIAWISAAWTVPIALGAVMSLWRLRDALQVMLWLPVLYFTLVHCVYIGSVRYRIPLMLFLEMAAAVTAAEVIRRCCRRGDGREKSAK